MNISDARAITDALEDELRSVGTPERAEGEKRYLKSDLEFHGATVPQIRRVATSFRRSRRELSRSDLLKIVETLWDRPVHECRMLAVELLTLYGERLEAEDLSLVERLLRESRTWALVDTLAIRVAGRLVEQHVELLATLDRWAVDDDFWIRRSALLAQLGQLREGRGDFDRFSRHADAMLEEKEFFIRKAIGWALRDISRKHPDPVIGWISPRTHRASGVTMREVVRHLPEETRDTLMAAYKEKRAAQLPPT